MKVLHNLDLMALVPVMKRVLPSYDDLLTETEDGEIICSETDEQRSKNSSKSPVGADEEEEELGLKPVLPVGRYDEHFREGDEPSSGEQYLCTVRSQRSKLNRIFVCDTSGLKGVSLEELCRKYGGAKDLEQMRLEMDSKLAENFWESYKRSEQSVLEQFELIETTNETDHVLSIASDSTEYFKLLYETKEIQPTFPFLKSIDEDLIEKLINLHKKWLESETISALILADSDTVNNFVTWLNALLMLRDSRLTSPEISSLRQLALTLCTQKYRNQPLFQEIVLIIVKKYAQSDLIKFI